MSDLPVRPADAVAAAGAPATGPAAWDALAVRAAEVTPARVFLGRAGTGYRTAHLLALRADHAAARDALAATVDCRAGALGELAERVGLVEVTSQAGSLPEHLLDPGRGRCLAAGAAEILRAECPAGADLQVVLGDGLSALGLMRQAPPLVDALARAAAERGWTFGRPVFVRHCRVGILNDIGAVLDPVVVVLLIGERPGLKAADCLSAYLAYRPRPGHTDAERNVVASIHPGGVSTEAASARIVALAEAMRAAGRSGVTVKEP